MRDTERADALERDEMGLNGVDDAIEIFSGIAGRRGGCCKG